MSLTLPEQIDEFMNWDWPQIRPFYDELAGRDLAADNAAAWLSDWTRLNDLVQEFYNRLLVANMLDTTDEKAEQQYQDFLENIYPHVEEATNRLNQKFLNSGIALEGFEIPLRTMRAQADLFSEANLPLLAEHRKLGLVYNKIIGGQTIEWDGQELTPTQLVPLLQNAPRPEKERAWRLASKRVLEDRAAIDENWVKLMDLRRQIAQNAGLPDYRAYAWGERLRFDYTPADCETFHAAIEEVVVPVTRRLVYEKRRARLGVETLRPWDVSVNVLRTTEMHGDPLGRPPLQPFKDVDELKSRASAVFHRVDPQLGEYFDLMRRDGLLDLDNRKGKGPGAFCVSYPASRRPFVVMNAVGIHDDVQTALHESGHAFHVFESIDQPYYQLRKDTPMEFNEVASMAMELLAAPYLTADQGGFYTEQEAARARIEHLESLLIFWPYMAVVDAFQHWAYTNHAAATDPANCDAKWGELWDRYIVGVDWSGLEDDKVTGWHRKLHIHRYPFYYIEYGLAQLGAVQVWRGALQDQAGAVARYREALALGASATLPELYTAAGVRFAFDAGTLREAVELIEAQIEQLEVV